MTKPQKKGLGKKVRGNSFPLVEQRFVPWHTTMKRAAREERECMAWRRTVHFGSTLLVSIHQVSPNWNHKNILVGKDL